MMTKILVAEDDPDLGLLLRSILQNAGYEVLCITSGCPIVNHQCDWPDLFIIDKQMNPIDGFALCKFLRVNDRTKRIPIILISGDHASKNKALDIGADYFMGKPLNVDELKKTIKALTTLRQDAA